MPLSSANAHACNVIAPEDILLNTMYTFTISWSDHYQYWGENLRIDKNYLASAKLLHDIKPEFFLNMEVSKNGRLHWHGYILFKDYDSVRDFYVNSLYKIEMKAIMEIDTITDIQKWEDYIVKQTKFMNKTLSNQIAFDVVKDYNKRI